MSPALNRRFALKHFERGNASEVCIGKMFNFYPGLLRVYTVVEFHYHDGRHILAFTIVNLDCWFGGASIEINCLRMLEVSCVCCLKLGHTP